MAQRRSRREFMGLVGGLAAATALPLRVGAQAQAAAAAALDPRDPELVVVNAKVFTVDMAVPSAQGFAVKGGRFVAVGSTADIRGLAGKTTQLFDAKQMTVVPGFTDCHNHAGGD